MRCVKTCLLLFITCLANVIAHPSTDQPDTVAKLAGEQVTLPTNGPQPMANGPQPMANDPQPMANDPQPYVTLAKTAPLPYTYYYSGNPIFYFPQFQHNLHKLAEHSAFPFGYEGDFFTHYDEMHYDK